jgi:diguanylate cyclase (GGDEF)-like protein/PAS domain S-box-containing protein
MTREQDMQFSELRQLAETWLKRMPEERKFALQRTVAGEKQTDQLVEELSVHRVELELQQEELKRTNARLQEALDRYAELYDNAPVGYLTTNRNGKIIEANAIVADLLNLKQVDLLRQPLTRFIAPEDQDAYYFHLRHLFGKHLPHTCQLTLKPDHHRPIHVRLESRPVVLDDGSVQCNTAIIDISLQLQAETDLRRNNEELERRVHEQTRELRASISEYRRAELALQVRLRQLAALRDMLSQITSELDLDQLLRDIIRHAVVLLHADSGMLSSYDPGADELEVIACFNLPDRFIGTRQTLTENGTLQVVRTRRPLVIRNYQALENRLPQYDDLQARSLVLVPLLTANHVIGVLIIGHTDPTFTFQESDTDFLTMIGQQMAIAIQNARLFAETERLASIDPLTNLYNRRKFFEFAEQAFEHARRFSNPIAAIMLDLDHFKQVNDRFGHQHGDRVLQAVASCCRQTVQRAIDIVGRYGGEEIVLLLPETTTEQAAQIARRIKRCIHDLNIPISEDERRLTASFGVAGCPPYAALTLAQLIGQADEALYVAKRAGRNRIVVFPDEGLSVQG